MTQGPQKMFHCMLTTTDIRKTRKLMVREVSRLYVITSSFLLKLTQNQTNVFLTLSRESRDCNCCLKNSYNGIWHCKKNWNIKLFDVRYKEHAFI